MGTKNVAGIGRAMIEVDMRKVLLVGLVVPVAVAGAIAWAMLHSRNPIASARLRMAHGDMRGAELYLRQELRAHPRNPEASFLLGEVDLSLGNAEAAELEFKRAQAAGYDHAATVLPLGQAYLQQHHYAEALRDFDPARAPAAERGDVLAVRAAAQLSLGDIAGATTSSAQAEAADPAKREVLLTAARLALARDDLQGATTRIVKVLASKPDDADALLLRSEVAIRHGDAKSALADAQAVLAAAPWRLDANLMTGRALAVLDRKVEARAALARVLHASPKNVTANFLNATLALETRDYAGADASLAQLSPIIDKLPRGYYLLAVVKQGLGQTAQAEEAITKFLAVAPNDVAGLKLMVLIDLTRRRPAEAIATLKMPALAAHPDADTFDLTGQAQALSGDMADAKSSFAAAAKLAPRSAGILDRLAVTHLQLGDAEAAEATLQRSLQVDPNQPAVGDTLVEAALTHGDFTTAAGEVTRLRQTQGDSEAVGVLDAEVKRATLDFGGAAAELKDVLARFPDSRRATFQLFRLYALQGQREPGELVLTDYLHRHPGDLAALDTLLPLLLRDNQVDKAVALAEAAHAVSPDDVGVTEALAGAYVQAHQTGRALALLDRAEASLDPRLERLRARLLATDGKVAEAEHVFTDILRRFPKDTDTRLALAAVQTAGKRYDDAMATLRDGLTQTPGNPAVLGAVIGVDLRQSGIKQALADAATFASDPRNLPTARRLAGDAWMAIGKQEEAGAAYRSAFEAAPDSVLAIEAGTTLAQAGHPDQAAALLTPWVQSHDKDWAAQAILGSLDISAGHLDTAEKHLEAVLAGRQDDPVALNNLAWVKQQQGALPQARTLAERAYLVAPTPTIADTLGWILVQQGDVKAGLPLLAQATVGLDARVQSDAAYHYGYALNEAGRHEEARAQLLKATQVKADTPGKTEALKLLASFK